MSNQAFSVFDFEIANNFFICRLLDSSFNCLSIRLRMFSIISVFTHGFALAKQQSPAGRVSKDNFRKQRESSLRYITTGLHGLEPSAATKTAIVMRFLLCFPPLEDFLFSTNPLFRKVSKYSRSSSMFHWLHGS